MAQQKIEIPPLDPYGFTGPIRIMSGVARMGDITPGSPYGTGVPEYARWLYVGTTGNVSIVKWDGTTQLLKNVASGIFHPIFSTNVNIAGTTATDMVWGS